MHQNGHHLGVAVAVANMPNIRWATHRCLAVGSDRSSDATKHASCCCRSHERRSGNRQRYQRGSGEPKGGQQSRACTSTRWRSASALSSVPLLRAVVWQTSLGAPRRIHSERRVATTPSNPLSPPHAAAVWLAAAAAASASAEDSDGAPQPQLLTPSHLLTPLQSGLPPLALPLRQPKKQ